VELACEDKDPRFVQQLLEAFATFGNQAFRRVGVSSASEEVRFLEHRVGQLRHQADEAAARLREFQEKHAIVDLDSQAKAVVNALAALNSQRISKQLELDYARTFSSGDEATMQQLESQLAVVGHQLRDLESPLPQVTAGKKQPKNGSEKSPGLFPAALSVPKIRAEYETFYRDRKVAEATLVFALERLEGARANEARDVSTFNVLDAPALPTRPVRPKRLTLVAIATMLGAAAAVAFEWWRAGGRTVIAQVTGLGSSAGRKAA
jgi:tyrosine-protein kinase Etk/Wzc